MRHLKNLIFFFVIAGGVFYLVTNVAPVRERVMPLLHLPTTDVKGASTIRNPAVSSVTSQIQTGIAVGVQAAQKQLLNMKVLDILSGLQKVGVNVQSVEKFVQASNPSPTVVVTPSSIKK